MRADRRRTPCASSQRKKPPTAIEQAVCGQEAAERRAAACSPEIGDHRRHNHRVHESRAHKHDRRLAVIVRPSATCGRPMSVRSPPCDKIAEILTQELGLR